MADALEASRRHGVPVLVHCEDPALATGAMHEGEVSRRLGVHGIPAAAEEIFIDRDLALAGLTGGWLHVCHVSTGIGAKRIGAARRVGARATAEVTPHHLVMNDEWVARSPESHGPSRQQPTCGTGPNPDAKVNPPLRTADDADALIDALAAGVIDVVATDHAPHGVSEKSGRSFANAAFGLTGSELALPLMLDLVRAGRLALADVVNVLSTMPARLWNLDGGTLRPGTPADITIFDANEAWRVGGDRLVSSGTNTPLLDAELMGRVKWTFVEGDERFRDW
jgi:dihydroorotase